MEAADKDGLKEVLGTVDLGSPLDVYEIIVGECGLDQYWHAPTEYPSESVRAGWHLWGDASQTCIKDNKQ